MKPVIIIIMVFYNLTKRIVTEIIPIKKIDSVKQSEQSLIFLGGCTISWIFMPLTVNIVN